MAVSITAGFNQECLYHLLVFPQYFKVDIGKLQIQMESQYSFLYDSILQLITESLLSIFNSVMSDTMLDVFMTIANEQLEADPPIAFASGENNTVNTDERWTKIDVHTQYFETSSVGQVCYRINQTCKGFVDKPVQKKREFFTNNGMSYFLHQNVFDSQF